MTQEHLCATQENLCAKQENLCGSTPSISIIMINLSNNKSECRIRAASAILHGWALIYSVLSLQNLAIKQRAHPRLTRTFALLAKRLEYW